MSRYIYITLFLVVLAVPFLARVALVGRGAPVVEATGLRLVVVTPHNQDIRREFASAFSAWHQDNFGEPVTIDYRTPGGTNDIKRLLETTYQVYRDEKGRLPDEMPPNFKADIDVVWGGGDFFLDQELKPLGLLQPIPLDGDFLDAAFPQPTLAGVKLYDYVVDPAGRRLDPQWVGVCLSGFGIVYNPELYDALGLPHPRHWHDLTHEKLAGLVALADPSHSGSAAVAYMMVLQRAMADAEEALFAQSPELRSLPRGELSARPDYQQAIETGWKRGMGQLLLIAANARYFTDSASQVPNDVGNGEAAAGMAIDFYGRVYQESVGERRCMFVSPPAATAITPDPVGVLRGVKGTQRQLATRFVQFLITPEAQRLWILKPGQPGGPRQRGLRRTPVRQDVYADRTGWADDVNPFMEAGGFNQRGEWMVLFTDTRPIWAAAWIDSRDALKSAYARILKVPDAQRRARLIAELANLPIEMRDVAELRAQRRKIETQGNADQWKAAQRIAWANRFREHYAAVARKATGAEALTGATGTMDAEPVRAMRVGRVDAPLHAMELH